MTKHVLRSSVLVLVLVLCAAVAHAQFSSSLQGLVEDPSGAVVAGATVRLKSTATNVTQQTTTGANGDYRFVSIAPGPYVVSAESKGFAPHNVNVTLQTDQTMNVRIRLDVSTQTQTVEVTDQAPVLDTAETRTQMTISSETLDSLPLPGRNLLGLTTIAPGVTGLGISGSGGNGQMNDNYAAETEVQASANGRSSVGNVYVLDGLDITSDITPGVLNLVPNPDTIQEASVQVNTYNVDYGRNSSIVEVMTSRSGTSKYHLMASDYYTADWLHARTEFQPKQTTKIAKYHLNNMSFTAGGPIPVLHQAYFFTGWEPLIQQVPGTSQTTYEDPAFTAWAKTQWPTSIGVKLLDQYPASNASTTSVAKYGKDLYPTTCGTASAAYIPCSLPVIDNGVFNSSTTRDGLQYNIRGDKYWSKDRVYANYFRTGLDLGGPSVRVDHNSPQHYMVHSIQGDETHTFSPSTLNEAAFGYLVMEGHINPTGPFHVPIITVTGGWGTQMGVSKADEKYVQHHYVWRDAVTHVYKSHSIQVGYQGFFGDNLTYFGPWYSQPAFNFQNIPAFLQDQVYTESGVSYNLVTGQLAGLTGGSVRAHGSTIGIYAQDTWKATKKLTLTLGLRWDNFGNPAPNSGFIASNFFYGQGSTIEERVANGYVKQVPHVFNSSPKAWSPRVGVAFDPTGNSKWLIRGGFGMYHDWITLGNVQNEFGNPPAPVTVTFQSNSTGPAPIYNVGTSDTYPFGFKYPQIPTTGLNSAGGITGIQSNIAGNDPDLHASNTFNYNVTLERGLGRNASVAAGYSGSHSNELFTDFAGHTTNAYYGVDINNFPGSLIKNNGKFVRLNPNFGSIRYTVNGPTSTYNAFIAEFKGRFLRKGSIDMSYTRSSSYDDAGTYPTVQSNTGNYAQYWAPSYWDVPHRLSLAASYELPHIHAGPDFLHVFTDGWKPSVITILQSGTPFTVLNGNAWKSGQVPGAALSQTSPGDYNADGINSDLPNIPNFGYKVPTDRNHQLGRAPSGNGFATGPAVFTQSDFTNPSTLPGEGNEKINGYRNPGYANTDFALLKNNRITERANLQLRLEMYNLFNRASLMGTNGSINSASFGRSTNQYNSRFLQLGARVEF